MKEWSCKLPGTARRGLALIMTAALILSVLAPVCFVQAAKQTKPLLNAKIKSLYYDKSGKKAFTLKVKKNKVRMIIATNWKTSKKSVVALSKKKDTSVKLTAKKKGNATVTGTIKYVPNGKWAVKTVRLTCKVTSKQAPIAEQVPTVPNQIPMPTVAPLQPGMPGTGATSVPSNPSGPTLVPTDKTMEAPGETPYEPQETDLPTADQTATPTSPTDQATEVPEDPTDKPASTATQRPSRTFKPTKTTTPRPTSTGWPASSDYDVLGTSEVLTKADASTANKVVSNTDTFTLANGVLSGTFDDKDVSVVLDLGREVDMNAYRGVEVKGVIPGQIALEFYDSGLDMTQTKDNGAEKDWWETKSGEVYPFYIGSCAWRYEKGGMNYLKAAANGAVKWSDTKVAPTEETQRFSLNQLAQNCTGDWSRIRYVIVKSNKDPLLSEQGKFDKGSVTENRTPFTYRITGLKFLAEGVVDASDEGHYIIDTKMAAEMLGNVKSYYVDSVTEDEPADQRDTAMNLSDFKYICVKVKNTKKVKVGIVADGKTLADAVTVGEETGSGQRIVYFRVDTEENKELLKAVDAVSVQTDAGGTVLRLSGTKGEIGFEDGVTKVDVVPDGNGLYRSTIVTLEKYGTEVGGTIIVPTASPRPGITDTLKDCADFNVGAVVNYDQTRDVKFTALAKQQFDVVSFENEMKGYLLDVEASRAGNGDPVCDFTQADRMVEWAVENGLKVHGHVLIWAASTRDAFFYEGYDTSGKLVDRETLLRRMKSYEELVITHFEEKYPDTVIAWNVVNEAISDSAPVDPTTGLRLNVGGNKYYDIIGGDFIKYAFQYAKEAVAKTGKDIKLFYNDYNTFLTSKTNYIIDLINYINEDEKLLDCMGMEGYVLTYWPEASDVLKAMKRFAQCGVQVGINELCVRLNDDIAKSHNPRHETVTEEEIGDHAEKFKKMFEAYCIFNKEYPNTLTNVSIWALLDRPDLIDNKEHYDYGVYGTHSGLFTADLKAKQAFVNVIDVLKGKPELKPTPTANPWNQYVKPSPAANLTLKYNGEVKSEENPNGGKLEGSDKILFKDGEGYPKGGIDLMKYDRVIVKIAATAELTGDGSWFGMVGLNSSDSDYTSLNAYDDGFGTPKYMNDVPYDNGYVVTFKIPDDIDRDTWSPAEISRYADAINIHLANADEYANLTVKEIVFESDRQPTPTPNIIDLDEYTLDLKSEFWTNDFYDRTDNADGSITLTKRKGHQDWQVGEFGFAVPRDKVGDLHKFTEVIIKYRDSDLTDDSTKCGYVFHMGDDTEVGWIESEDGGHSNTLSFNGSGQISIYAGETKSGQSEKDFSTMRIYDGKLGGMITIESITLAKGKPVPTKDPYVPQGPGWQKLDLSAWSGDNDNYIGAGDQVVLSAVELETVPLPRNLDGIGDKIEVLIRGSVPKGSDGFRYWVANDNGGTLTTMGHYSNFGEGVEDPRNAHDPKADLDVNAFQAGQFQVQRVLEHINKDNVADDQLTGTKLLLKGPSYGTTLDGIIITGIWVRYGEDIGIEYPELTIANSVAVSPLFESDYTTSASTGMENEDGSITFYTTAKYSGGGLNFYLNKDKSHFDMTKYKKIQVTLSAEQEGQESIYLGLVTDGKAPVPWDASQEMTAQIDAKPSAYLDMTGGGKDDVYEIDLTQMKIPQNTDKGADCGVVMLQIKYNGYQQPEDTQAAITVKSIKFMK